MRSIFFMEKPPCIMSVYKSKSRKSCPTSAKFYPLACLSQFLQCTSQANLHLCDYNHPPHFRELALHGFNLISVQCQDSHVSDCIRGSVYRSSKVCVVQKHVTSPNIA